MQAKQKRNLILFGLLGTAVFTGFLLVLRLSATTSFSYSIPQPAEMPQPEKDAAATPAP